MGLSLARLDGWESVGLFLMLLQKKPRAWTLYDMIVKDSTIRFVADGCPRRNR